MTKTMYEISWHYKDSEQNQFLHCTVRPITIIRESVLPGCTAVSITAKDSKGRTFQGSSEDYFETEAAAWAAVKQDILGTIESYDKTVVALKEETHRLFSFLITLPDLEAKP